MMEKEELIKKLKTFESKAKQQTSDQQEYVPIIGNFLIEEFQLNGFNTDKDGGISFGCINKKFVTSELADCICMIYKLVEDKIIHLIGENISLVPKDEAEAFDDYSKILRGESIYIKDNSIIFKIYSVI